MYGHPGDMNHSDYHLATTEQPGLIVAYPGPYEQPGLIPIHSDQPPDLHYSATAPPIEYLGDAKYVVKSEERHAPAPGDDQAEPNSTGQKYRRRVCGLPDWAVLLILAALIAVGVGVGAGLGLGLKKSSSPSSSSSPTSPSQPSPSSSVNPSYISTTGAWNGTGIGVAQTSAKDADGQIELYFQHHTGSIRWMTWDNDGAWTGGGNDHIVASDALDGTPLSIVAYDVDEDATVAGSWHLFYVNNQNIFVEKIRTSSSTTWTDGPLNKLAISPLNESNIAFQTCYNVYLGPAYAPGTFGLSILYASDPQTIQQVDWINGNPSWSLGDKYTGNGRAAVNCYTEAGTTRYVMFFDLQNNFKMIWRDFDTNNAATATHPINEWTNTTISITGELPNLSLAGNGLLTMQQSNLELLGYNVTYAAEATELAKPFSFDVEPVAGSRVGMWMLPTTSKDPQITIFVQSNGSDITMVTVDMNTGGLSSPVPVQIPN